MSLNIPTSQPDFQRINYAEGEVITAQEILDIAEASHLSFALAGVISPIQTFDPVFKTASTSYTMTNADAGTDYALNLQMWPGNIPIRQIVQSDVKYYGIALVAALRSAEMQIEIRRGDQATSTLTVTNTAATWQNVTDAVFFTPAQADFNGHDDFITASMGIRLPAGAAAANARVANFALYSVIATSAQLPRGR